MRRRLDLELVRRGIADSRSRATAFIQEGNVLVSGAVADKPSRLVAPGEPIELMRRARFVSRGGEKLDGALTHLGLEVAGRRCLDVGASTGGFTDCLLQRGAAHVDAVDVGHGQIDPGLRSDPRVDVREGLNARDLAGSGLGGGYDVVVADVSFISLLLVLPGAVALARPGADFVVLVKPQFEAGRRQVERGGVVRSPDVHRDVLRAVADGSIPLGLDPRAVFPASPRGPAGNQEFFLHAVKGSAPSALADHVIADAVAAAHRDAS